MRWFWIDRFTEFESGHRATAVKCISLAEEHMHDHFPYYPVIPHTLVIEGIAQAGGLLVGETSNFERKVVLAKLPKAIFHFPASAGDVLTYTTTITYIKNEGARVMATSHRGDELHAEVEILFASLNNDRIDSLFDPGVYQQMMRLLGAYDVGRAADGSPLLPPADYNADE